MFDNTLTYGKIHGDLNGINTSGGNCTGRKYDFPHLLNKIGEISGDYDGLFWHCGNVR